MNDLNQEDIILNRQITSFFKALGYAMGDIPPDALSRKQLKHLIFLWEN